MQGELDKQDKALEIKETFTTEDVQLGIEVVLMLYEWNKEFEKKEKLKVVAA